MKKLSIKRIVSFAVVAVMLFASFAATVSADFWVVPVNMANTYNSDSDIVVWASKDESATILSVAGAESGAFADWVLMLTQYNEENSVFDVIGVSGEGDTSYEDWTLGYGKLAFMATMNSDYDGYETIAYAFEGDPLYPVGDYDAAYDAQGEFTGTIFYCDPPSDGSEMWEPTLEAKAPEYDLGVNVDVDSEQVAVQRADVINQGLADGNRGENAADFKDSAIFLLQNEDAEIRGANYPVNLVWYFAEATDVNYLEFSLYVHYDSMIGVPATDIAIYSSDDAGLTWNQIDTVQHTLSVGNAGDAASVQTAKLLLSETFTGTHFKAELIYPDSPFTADQGYPDTPEKPVWEFFALTEASLTLVDPDTVPVYSTGDLDGSKEIDYLDYILLKRHVMNTLTIPNNIIKFADINADDTVNYLDYILLKRAVMGEYTIGA